MYVITYFSEEKDSNGRNARLKIFFLHLVALYKFTISKLAYISKSCAFEKATSFSIALLFRHPAFQFQVGGNDGINYVVV